MARKRILSEVAVQKLLADLGRARSACIAFRTDAPIGNPHYNAAGEVMLAIDRFAEVAVGDRAHFHAKMCPVDQGPSRS